MAGLRTLEMLLAVACARARVGNIIPVGLGELPENHEMLRELHVCWMALSLDETPVYWGFATESVGLKVLMKLSDIVKEAGVPIRLIKDLKEPEDDALSTVVYADLDTEIAPEPTSMHERLFFTCPTTSVLSRFAKQAENLLDAHHREMVTAEWGNLSEDERVLFIKKFGPDIAATPPCNN